jgi:mannan endo-1,4-beta-mannosidase
VTRDGSSFTLDGKEFRFVGFNLFDAANTSFPDQGKTGYSCPRDAGWWKDIYTETELDQALKQMKNEAGANVLRFWAFQRYTNGGTDWSGIDKVIRVAKRNGFKVIPVLEDGPGYCTFPEPQGTAKWKYSGDTWYTDGFRKKMGSYQLTYPEYVKAIVSRYKDEPAIFGWAMMNEADTSKRVAGANGDESALVGFAREIGTLIKSIDKNHLLTVGTQSNGASGASGKDYVAVHNVKGPNGEDLIDFGEVHDWPFWGGDTQALPGSADGTTLPDPESPDCVKTYQAKLGCSIANSVTKLNKPILMGEAGISARDDAGRTRRAALMDAKINAFFNAGGAGYLVWQWNKVIDREAYDVQPTTRDPLLAVMKKYASDVQIPAGNPVVSAQPTAPAASPIVTPTPTPTKKPSPTPTPRVSPTPAVKPSPSPTPSASPSTQGNQNLPVARSATNELEAESILGGEVFADSVASGGKGLLLNQNTTVKGQITGSFTSLTVRAKADVCQGNPHILVKVDNRFVLDTQINTTSYKDFTNKNLAYMKLNDGPHTVEISYNNDFSSSSCNRNVRLDVIRGE